MSPRECGRVLIDGVMGTYAAQTGIAWSLANGLDPTRASGALRRALDAVEQQANALGEVMEEEIRAIEDAIPGASGSKPGAAPTVGSKTSGG